MLDFSFFVENRLRRHNTALRPTRHPVAKSLNLWCSEPWMYRGRGRYPQQPVVFSLLGGCLDSQAVLGYLGMSWDHSALGSFCFFYLLVLFLCFCHLKYLKHLQTIHCKIPWRPAWTSRPRHTRGGESNGNLRKRRPNMTEPWDGIDPLP